jgi:hypothetical protein
MKLKVGDRVKVIGVQPDARNPRPIGDMFIIKEIVDYFPGAVVWSTTWKSDKYNGSFIEH